MRPILSSLVLTLLGLTMLACGSSSSEGEDTRIDVGITDDQIDTAADVAPEGLDIPSDAVPCTSDAECLARLGSGPCLTARCDLALGRCEALVLPDHTLCDDGDKCSAGDTCRAGECVRGDPIDCDDGNPCTDDACDPDVGGRGCVHLPVSGVACDDGALCSVNDTCQSGKCVGEAAACACSDDLDCEPFEDANLCNGTLTCQAGLCRVDAATVIDCNDPFVGPCERRACVPSSGLCATDVDPDGASCEDGNPCTTSDVCDAGTCQPGAYVCGACTADDECEGFEDGDRCNGAVVCMQGECLVDPDTVPVCDTSDDTACERTVCLPGTGACDGVRKAEGAACSDGNLCSLGDHCVAGQCLSSAARTCDDDNACTSDTCDPKAGCVFSPNALACDDGDACTLNDRCSEGACKPGLPRSCDDGNVCTADACMPATGCVSTPNTASCEDGNPCTVSDACSSSVCLPGTNECPCMGDADCEAFDNGDRCDGVLVCVNQRCVVKPNSIVSCDPSGDTQCKVNSCNPDTGTCGFVFLPEGTTCNDGDLCTQGDSCVGGACLAGFDTLCGDGDPCTTDGCSSGTGCQHTPIAACTGCSTDEACADADPCTQDACQAGSCVHPAVDGLPCEDGDPCTADDQCADGVCVSGTGNACAAAPCQATVDLRCEQRVEASLLDAAAPDDLDRYACNLFDFTGPEHVYRFQPEVSGLVTFTLFGESDLYLVLLEDQGQGCSTGACLATHTLEVSWEVNGGSTYYLAVDGYGGAVSPYQLLADCSWTDPEDCANALDDDQDGLTDCADPDCATFLLCYEYGCANGSDDDGDGRLDCADPDCFDDAVCTGGWSGDSCEDSFVVDLEGFGAEDAGSTLVRWGSTAGMADDYSAACQGDPAADGPDVAYLLALSEPMRLDLHLDREEDAPAALSVYAAPLCALDYRVACATAAGRVATLSTNLPAGSYYVVVDEAAAGSGGVYTLSMGLDVPVTAEAVCTDGLDEDLDGVTDCDDVDDCGAANRCAATDACLDGTATVCGQVSFASLHGDEATDVVETYTCPSRVFSGYQGAEHAWSWVSLCEGTARARLEVSSSDEALVDLFVLDAAQGCVGDACVAVGEAAAGVAQVEWPVTPGAAFHLVADGYQGALGNLSLTLECVCVETCKNGVDDDGDGLTDCADLDDCLGTVDCPATYETDCGDGVDNDADQDVDCADLDCLVQGVCPELACADLDDGDFDGKTDCADPDCAQVTYCAQTDACLPAYELQCGFGLASPMRANNATDAITSWSGCDPFGSNYSGPEIAFSFVPPCTGHVRVSLEDLAEQHPGSVDLFVLDAAEACTGGSCRQAIFSADGVASGLIDVTKGEPVSLVADGWQGYASDIVLLVDCLCLFEACNDGVDNDADGKTDCADDECALYVDCPEPDCANGVDEDGDGATDCADDACAATPACPELACGNGLDDNHDGKTDCADVACFDDDACTGGFGGDSCDDSFLLAGDHAFGAGDVGTVLTRGQSLFGATATLDESVACGGWAALPDHAYHLAVAEQVDVTFRAGFQTSTSAGLVLYESGCLPGQSIACQGAEQGVATLTRTLPAGEYFVVVKGSSATSAGGCYDLRVSFAATVAHETHCGDGVDDDADGLTDCADTEDCALANRCASPGACSPLRAADCGVSSEGDLSSHDATDAIDAYACPGYVTGDSYGGPEYSWEHVSGCKGTVTATLTLDDDPGDRFIELFVLSGDGACTGDACVAVGYFGNPIANQASVSFPAELGQRFVLVADGFDGAVGQVKVDVTCACDEVCDNDLDDDGDGLKDCADTDDCAGVLPCPALRETDCDDGIDEDQDGLTDCQDLDCLLAPGACLEVDCVDGADDNLNDKIDCADPDCADDAICAATDACVPAGDLACDEVLAGALLANDSTDVLAAYACDTFGSDYSGPERTWRVTAPCDGTLDFLVADKGGDGVFDAFVLDGAVGCTGAACLSAHYAGSNGDVSGSIAATNGAVYYLVVDGWAGALHDVEVLLTCSCN